MAVQLFKDGACTYVEPSSLQHHLQVGWSLVDPNAPVKLPPGVEIINPPDEAKPEPKKRGRKPKAA